MHMSFLAATYSSILLHGDVVSVTSAVEQDGADHAIYKKTSFNKNMSYFCWLIPNSDKVKLAT